MEKRDFEGISIVGPETEPKEPTCNQLSTAEMAAENCVYYQKQCTACRYDFNTGNLDRLGVIAVYDQTIIRL